MTLTDETTAVGVDAGWPGQGGFLADETRRWGVALARFNAGVEAKGETGSEVDDLLPPRFLDSKLSKVSIVLVWSGWFLFSFFAASEPAWQSSWLRALGPGSRGLQFARLLERCICL